MTKQIKKYVGFNPASSEASEWWTANTLKELSDIFWACGVEDKPIRKLGHGFYRSGSIEVYNIEIHPNAKDGLE